MKFNFLCQAHSKGKVVIKWDYYFIKIQHMLQSPIHIPLSSRYFFFTPKDYNLCSETYYTHQLSKD